MKKSLPAEQEMYQALLNRDESYEGIFFVGVKTTGIFCRPGCTARKPKLENVEFFPSTHEALCRGYRPCKICQPMTPRGETPDWLKPLMEKVETSPTEKIKDYHIRQLGLDPNRVRRWFQKNHNMTFQAYLRTLRIGQAFGRIRLGEGLMHTAYDSGYESISGFNDAFKKTTGFTPAKSRRKQLVYITRILTPLGPMLTGATERGICLFEFIDRWMLETQLKRIHRYLNAQFVPGDSPLFEQLDREMREYFAGQRRQFTVPLELTGSDFQKSVWQMLQQIPYGTTRSYSEQARLLGRPEALRAVAKANGDNKIAIIIPCHRVIGANGDLTGYGGGLWRKRYLLELEQGR